MSAQFSSLPMRPDRVRLLADYPRYRRDPLNFWLETGKLAPLVDVRLGPWVNYWVVTDPDWLQHILQGNVRNYPRDRRLLRANRRRNVELLFSTDQWEEWLWRRRLMQPAFHRTQVEGFAEMMVQETLQAIKTWQYRTVIPFKTVMKQLTMRIIARAMFSAEALSETRMLQQSYETTTHIAYEIASSVWPSPFMLLTPRLLTLKRAADRRIRYLETLVMERVQSGGGAGDLLDTLIAARVAESGAAAEKGRAFTAAELVWEMSGIVFAGHDTTALTLTWLFYLLAQHPTVADRLREELSGVLCGNLPTAETVQEMPYLEWVILETMRLYPAVYVTIRETDERDQFAGREIPVGTKFLLNIRGMHHHPDHWEQPERFDPHRFDPARGKTRHKFAFLPFLQGPKKCMGDALAMLEMKIIAATLLTRYEFTYKETGPLRMRPSFVLEAEGEVPLHFHPLNRPSAAGLS
jgi:cytochrome P450